MNNYGQFSPGYYNGYYNYYGWMQPTYRQQLNAFALLSNPNRYNGYRVKSPDRPEIYLIDNGKRRHITNPDVYNQLFRNWDGIHTVIDIENIPLGSAIREGTGLFKTSKSNKVFWLDKEHDNKVVKRWITSPQAMDKYNFNWDKVATVYDYFADGIRDGSNIQ
jgi:hypothetical protein